MPLRTPYPELQAWKEQVLNIVVSKLHNDVSGTLQAMGIPHQNEFLTEDQLFSIDIAITDQKLALEVDGPFHFTANTHATLGEQGLSAHPAELGCAYAQSQTCWSSLACRRYALQEKIAGGEGMAGMCLLQDHLRQ